LIRANALKGAGAKLRAYYLLERAAELPTEQQLGRCFVIKETNPRR
jgi:hypothetical protein